MLRSLPVWRARTMAMDKSIRSCSARRRPRASRAPMWLSIEINCKVNFYRSMFNL